MMGSRRWRDGGSGARYKGQGASHSPLVSVIIPAFNTEHYVAHAVNSALRQTMSDLEVIVVDDGSTDGTLVKVEGITDPRLRVISLAENGGVAAARNRAIDEATGEWVAVLDSDDWFATERLEVLLGVAAETRADMVADDLWFINDGEASPWTTLLAQSDEIITGATEIAPARFVLTNVPGRNMRLGLSQPIIRRDFLEEFKLRYDEALVTHEDFFFYLDCLKHGARFVLFPQAYYYYRRNRRGSLTNGGSKVVRLASALAACERRLKQPEVECHRDLYDSIRIRANLFKELLAYYRVVEPLKNCEWIDMVKALIETPQVIISLANRLPEVVLSRYWQRNR